MTLTLRDEGAVSAVRFFLHDNVPDIADFSDTAESAERMGDFLNEGCCVVFGAPGVSHAAELAICQVFDSMPWEPRAVELPNCLSCFATTRDRGLASSLLSPESAGGQAFGIYLKSEGLLIPSAVYR